MSALDAALASAVADAMRPLIDEIRALRAEVAQLRRNGADDLLTVEQAAKLLDCSPAALRKKIARGSVPAVRSGRSVRLRRCDLTVSVGGHDV